MANPIPWTIYGQLSTKNGQASSSIPISSRVSPIPGSHEAPTIFMDHAPGFFSIEHAYRDVTLSKVGK